MLNPVTFSLTDAAGVQSQVTASHPDYVAFEMKYDKPVIEQLQRGMVSTYLFLVYSAMKRQGLTDVAFEMKYDKPVIEQLQRGMVSTYLFLVYSAMKRQGLTDVVFESWLESPPEIEIEAKATEPVPLGQKPPPGPSPASPSRRA